MAPHYSKAHNEYNAPLIKVYECWNLDIMQAIPIKVAAMVKGTGNKLAEESV
jgi:hypothetical protein